MFKLPSITLRLNDVRVLIILTRPLDPELLKLLIVLKIKLEFVSLQLYFSVL